MLVAITTDGASRMMIVDALSSASTQYAVYFLVTAYIESLRHFDASVAVPKGVLHLPLSGREDLAIRLAALQNNINVPLEAAVPVSEVARVLASALQRLSALDSLAIESRPVLRAA
jgi:hypothetical protein